MCLPIFWLQWQCLYPPKRLPLFVWTDTSVFRRLSDRRWVSEDCWPVGRPIFLCEWRGPCLPVCPPLYVWVWVNVYVSTCVSAQNKASILSSLYICFLCWNVHTQRKGLEKSVSAKLRQCLFHFPFAKLRAHVCRASMNMSQYTNCLWLLVCRVTKGRSNYTFTNARDFVTFYPKKGLFVHVIPTLSSLISNCIPSILSLQECVVRSSIPSFTASPISAALGRPRSRRTSTRTHAFSSSVASASITTNLETLRSTCATSVIPTIICTPTIGIPVWWSNSSHGQIIAAEY